MAFSAPTLTALLGTSAAIPPELLAAFPELHAIRLRRGGLAPRLGGWCLGQRCVAGITFGRWVWLAPDVVATAELLLHEVRHVHQFQALRGFPLRYVWESLRRGYLNNRYEVDARRYVAWRLTGAATGLTPREDG
jgi:hypothetical protein